MSFFRQIWVVTAMNIAALPSRIGASLVTVIGVATVVAVMISLLSISEGVNHSVARNDQPDRAIVLAPGATETMGNFSPSQVGIIALAPGIKRGADGKPMVQPLAAVIVELQDKDDNATNNVLFRGSGVVGASMNKASLHLIEGRTYRPGLHELIVGKATQRHFRNLAVGDHVMLRGTSWAVVGAYEDQGGIDENSIVADADTVLAAFNRTGYQSIGVQLASPADFRRFKDALTSNPQLQVEVKHLSQYYKDQVGNLPRLLNVVGYFVGGIMALGVVFGALNTMFSAVDARVREIATLRAIGFGGTAVVVSVITEALVLAIPGALIGSAFAWLLFNNHDIAMGGIGFPMAVTPQLMTTGLIVALAIGLVGGLAPSIRAARLPVAAALRAT